MRSKLSRDFASDIEALAAAITKLESDTRSQRSYFASAGFRRAFESGQSTQYRALDDPEYVRDAERFGGRDLLRALSHRAHALQTSFAPRLFGVSNLTIGYAGSRRLRSLLHGVANIVDIDAHAEKPFDGVFERVDLVIIGYPVNGDDFDLAGPAGKRGSLAVLESLTAELSRAGGRTNTPLVLFTSGEVTGLTGIFPFTRYSDLVVTFGDRSVDTLRMRLGGSPEVWHVPPFFSPAVHSPIGRNRFRFDGGLFWGDWPAANQHGRWKALLEIFEAFAIADVPLVAVESGLFPDRASARTQLGGSQIQENRPSPLPWQFVRNAIPKPDPQVDAGLRKLFDYHVIANLHPGQPWSFPLELLPTLASGSATIASYSVGMNNEFPHVMLADSEEDVALQLRWLRNQPAALAEVQARSVRRAFEAFTADGFIHELGKKLGLHVDRPTALVEVVAETQERRRAFLAQQVIPNDAAVRVESKRGASANIRFTVRDGVEYGPHALLDAVNGFRMSSADAVKIGPAGSEQDQEWDLAVRGSLSSVDAIWLEPMTRLARMHRVPVFTNRDPAQVLTVGGGQVREHAGAQIRVSVAERSRDLTVVVPVFNNGRHLEGKCFASLQRSTIFERMHIHLIDDGSTDDETLAIVRQLAERYPNVESYFFETGGSGSASRPRNFGLEHASTPFVTYLDPDNEATGDGYARLLDLCRTTGVDFAIGNMIRLAKARTVIRNVDVLRRAIEFGDDSTGQVAADTLTRINFQPMSIQALVADTTWLRSTGIEQPLGALGQDSLFFQMVLHEAVRIAILDESIHSYYGEVAGSMVNTVTPGFFRKYLPLEQARSEWLKREGLFETYSEVRARPFFRVWFWPRFNGRVASDKKVECFGVLRDLAAIYGIRIRLADDGQTLIEEE